ncbi:hypothetical protein Tco_0767482 [Tanacetum coccineum]
MLSGQSIQAAYAAHPTPDVFINFASVRSLPSKLWAIIVEGVRKSDTNELISYARFLSEQQRFVGFKPEPSRLVTLLEQLLILYNANCTGMDSSVLCPE